MRPGAKYFGKLIQVLFYDITYYKCSIINTRPQAPLVKLYNTHVK